MTPFAIGHKQGVHAVLLFAGLAMVLVRILHHAWVYEDAYITFRVVDNLVQGYGLRWNVHERVQAYTNPLWMLLHIPFYALWPDIFHLTIMLSVLCTLGGIALVLRTFRKPALTTACFLLLPFGLSRTLTEYATSGLENPLSFLLFAAFGWVIFHAPARCYWFLTGLTISLAMVNRLDTVLLYLPVLLYLMATRRPQLRWGQLILGFLPIAAWLSFSLLYYGFFFPNTVYAKLHTGVATREYIAQGLYYLLNLFAMDLPAALWVCTALGLAGRCVLQYGKLRDNDSGIRGAIGLGLLAYLLYVVYAGGSHGSGRFWSLHVAVAVWLIYSLIPLQISWRLQLAYACIIVAVYVHYPSMKSLRSFCPPCFSGEIVPRGIHIALARHGVLPQPNHNTKPPRVRVRRAVGIKGYRAGPSLILIDVYGLGDAFLARMPSTQKKLIRVGHFPRRVPTGYLHAVATGSPEQIRPRRLRKYYRKLRLVISGDLWDKQRLKTIWEFQRGKYDHLLKPKPAKKAA